MGKKGELIKTKCIDAALDIINKEGVDKLTIRNILSATNLRNGSLYKQFQNIDEIIFNVNIHTLKKIKSLVEDAITKGDKVKMPKQKVLCIIASKLISFSEQENDYWRLLFEKEVINNSELPVLLLKEIEDVFMVLVNYLSNEDNSSSKKGRGLQCKNSSQIR